ncbi:MAG: ComF family protein, partial [Polyangiales bacterium]
MGELVEEMLTLVAPPGCAACTASVPRVVDVFCRACASLVETHEHPSAAYEYGGPVADAIRRFKYEGQSHLALPLGAALARGACRWAGRVDMVVPVPLHWRRRWGRGYDQAGLLAKPVARSLGVPLRLRTLRRTRNTPKQASLRGSERRSNMLGAFASRALPPNARVLLVDDVR